MIVYEVAHLLVGVGSLYYTVSSCGTVVDVYMCSGVGLVCTVQSYGSLRFGGYAYTGTVV